MRVEVQVANGYCVKCKTSREIKDAKQITMKNGRPATQGLCPVCGTKIFKIGGGASATAPAAAATPSAPAATSGGPSTAPAPATGGSSTPPVPPKSESS